MRTGKHNFRGGHQHVCRGFVQCIEVITARSSNLEYQSSKLMKARPAKYDSTTSEGGDEDAHDLDFHRIY